MATGNICRRQSGRKVVSNSTDFPKRTLVTRDQTNPTRDRKLHDHSQTVRCTGFSRHTTIPPKGGTTNGANRLMQFPSERGARPMERTHLRFVPICSSRPSSVPTAEAKELPARNHACSRLKKTYRQWTPINASDRIVSYS